MTQKKQVLCGLQVFFNYSTVKLPGCRAAALLTGEHDLMGCDRDMCMMWKEGYVERIRRTLDEVNAKYGMSEEKGGIY